MKKKLKHFRIELLGLSLAIIALKLEYDWILEKLRWESLSRLILLYKGLKGGASIPTDDLIPLIGHCRNSSLNFQTPAAWTDIYKGTFFPQAIRIPF